MAVSYPDLRFTGCTRGKPGVSSSVIFWSLWVFSDLILWSQWEAAGRDPEVLSGPLWCITPWAHEQKCSNNSARKGMRWWMHFLAPFFCCFCTGRAQCPSWCFKSPMSWWIWPLGFRVACECGWWPVWWLILQRDIFYVPAKGKPWVMVMPHSALMSGLD